MSRVFIYKIGTLTIFAALLIPGLVQEGMFLDGITYAAISKNLANGYGQFWDPHYTKVLYPSFSEHPPLVFIIQSLFFTLFGDHFYTERIYSFLTALLTALGIILCWKEMAKTKDVKDHYWLPVLLWLLVPVVSWSYRNNMLENTMTVFSLFSVFFILKALKWKNYYLILASSLLILVAFLSKGFVGLFPLMTPLIYGVVYRENKRAILCFTILVSSLIVFSAVAIEIFPGLAENISRYLNQQFLPALKGQREITADSRFQIVFDLFLDLALILGISMAFVFGRLKNKKPRPFVLTRDFVFFLLVGFCASIPLIISLKQRKFYLLPSIPFYALSAGFFLHDHVSQVLQKIPQAVIRWLARLTYIALVLVLILSIVQYGEYSRDKDKIQDVKSISNSLDAGAIIGGSREMCSDWLLIAYFSRNGYISLDCVDEHDYFLIKNGDKWPSRFGHAEYEGNGYTLLKRSTESDRLDR